MERWTAVLSPNSLGLERVKRARQAERTISSKANNTSCKSSFLERCAHAATPFLSSSLEDDFSVSSSLGLIARAHTHTRSSSIVSIVFSLLSFSFFNLFDRSPFPSPSLPFSFVKKNESFDYFFRQISWKVGGEKKKKKNLTISFNSRLSKAHCRRRRRRS